MKRFKIDPYTAVYAAISISTFSHTMVAAATIFEGSRPNDIFGQIYWGITGILIAIAIDVGMLVSSHHLVKQRSAVMFIAFITAALVSFFTQTLYSVQHLAPLEIGAGVTQYWKDFLRPVLDARFLIMSAALPLFATIYTFAKMRTSDDERKQAQKAALDALKPSKRRSDQFTIENPNEKSTALVPVTSYALQLDNPGTFPLGWQCTGCGRVGHSYKDERTRLSAARTHITRNHPEVTDREEGIRTLFTFFGSDDDGPISNDQMLSIRENVVDSLRQRGQF